MILLVTLINNRKSLLAPALQSAVNQTLDKKHWHHLLINNASTDGAEEVANVYVKKYPNMTLVNMTENLGQQKAYNYVLKEWPEIDKYKVMAVLDSDDRLEPIALNEVYKMYNEHPEIGGAYSGFNIINASGKVKVKDHPKAKYIANQFTEEGQRRLRQIFLKENLCGHMRSYNIKSLNEIGGFSEEYRYATDYNIFGSLMLAKKYVVKINKVIYNFTIHGDQVQGTNSPQQTQDWKDLQIKFRKLFTEKGII